MAYDDLMRALLARYAPQPEATLASVLRDAYRSPVREAVETPQPIERNAMNVGPVPGLNETLARYLPNASPPRDTRLFPALSDQLMAPLNAMARFSPEAAFAANFMVPGKSPMSSLPMDEASRWARAREQGFDTTSRYYHGTASDFDTFDKAKFGSATGANSAHQGAWLVSDPTTAAGYARYAAEAAPIRKLMQDADTYERLAQKTGNEKWWDKQHQAVVKAEELEKQLRENGAPGQRVMPLFVRGRYAEHDMKGAEFTDVDKQIASIIRDAKANGYDGVKFHNLADDTGLNGRPATHVVVFEPENLRSPWNEFKE